MIETLRDLRPSSSESHITVYEMGQAGDDEYGVLRFYNMTDAAVASIICGEVEASSRANVPFPFRMSEREQRYTLLPHTMMVLMGRSGTGKTTTCHSRMRYDLICDCGEQQRLRDSGSGQPTAESEPLYQLFVTRNAMLCKEVRHTFHDYLLSCGRVSEAGTMRYPFPCPPGENVRYPPTQQLPEHFKKPCALPAHACPMFVSSSELWPIIDRSLPGQRFLSDGATSQMVMGRLDDATAAAIGASTKAGASGGGTKAKTKTKADGGCVTDGKTLMTFELFLKKYWGEEGKQQGALQTTARNQPGYDSSYMSGMVIWNCFKSFIKGSLEAVEKGRALFRDEFLNDMGQKRAQISEKGTYNARVMIGVSHAIGSLPGRLRLF